MTKLIRVVNDVSAVKAPLYGKRQVSSTCAEDCRRQNSFTREPKRV